MKYKSFNIVDDIRKFSAGFNINDYLNYENALYLLGILYVLAVILYVGTETETRLGKADCKQGFYALIKSITFTILICIAALAVIFFLPQSRFALFVDNLLKLKPGYFIIWLISILTGGMLAFIIALLNPLVRKK